MALKGVVFLVLILTELPTITGCMKLMIVRIIKAKVCFMRKPNSIRVLSCILDYTCLAFGKTRTLHCTKIALFTVNFSHLHYNVFKRGCEAISGRNCKIARNCLTSTFKHIVMQMSKVNCEKGY